MKPTRLASLDEELSARIARLEERVRLRKLSDTKEEQKRGRSHFPSESSEVRQDVFGLCAEENSYTEYPTESSGSDQSLMGQREDGEEGTVWRIRTIEKRIEHVNSAVQELKAVHSAAILKLIDQCEKERTSCEAGMESLRELLILLRSDASSATKVSIFRWLVVILFIVLLFLLGAFLPFHRMPI